MVTNPFNLYDGKEYEIDRYIFNRDFLVAWRKFQTDVQKARKKARSAGASDTAAREDQVKWIKKHVEDLY